MKRVLNVIAALLLLFNGLGAMYGGLNLIVYPDGSTISLSEELLEYSFFDSYLVPGIVLLLSNGVFSVYVFAALVLKYSKYWRLIALQGVVLILSLILQIALIHVTDYFHLVMFFVGIGLVAIGLIEEDISDRPIPHKDM